MRSKEHGGGRRGLLRRTFMVTDPREPYMLIYTAQTGRNRFAVNLHLTELLERAAGGLRRPWIGPVLVDYERSGVLTADNLVEEAETVAEHIHTVYERFHPDHSVLFDALPIAPGIKVFSEADFRALEGRSEVEIEELD
ncbi:hypothetical protein VNI00_018029 [Paramarasmius palmivorus]|uniref:Uncharacterized protein n=1 Tax=Paramarasmius palmivorus TaxID=297713 RepID=A0AAW0B365_9AGAR